MKTLLLSAALLLSLTGNALAQETVIVMPQDKIVAKAPVTCTVRALDQGRGNVRICSAR